ncbi:hypothetical protein D7X25_14530 [bacterium 1XD42-8]|nr:hypothetical protein D7X25_14530 [bacterium 1XD42-8]
MSCPFLEQQETSSKVQPGRPPLWGVNIYFSTYKDKNGVLQSTSIMKLSTPSNMYPISLPFLNVW